jgi:hypothetical protein
MWQRSSVLLNRHQCEKLSRERERERRENGRRALKE